MNWRFLGTVLKVARRSENQAVVCTCHIDIKKLSRNEKIKSETFNYKNHEFQI